MNRVNLTYIPYVSTSPTLSKETLSRKTMNELDISIRKKINQNHLEQISNEERIRNCIVV